jgi:hypothetical protein
VNHESEMLEANHNLPARTMADEDRARHDDKDDAATMATSKELEQTTISDRVDIASEKPTSSERHEDVDEEGDKKMPEPEPVKARTPEPSAPETVEVDEDMRDRISSPKKKRGRDQDDDARDVETAEAGETTSSVEGVLNGSRTTRSGPEKKRPRDTSNELTKAEKSETEKVCLYFVQAACSS